MPDGAPTSRHVWTPRDISDTSGPGALLRAYLEQRDLRRCLRKVTEDRPLASACDVGCGYGRLTPVLTEFAPRVVGFEREPRLVAQARHLQPEVEFAAVDSLSHLPAAGGEFGFAMTFTVLQHLGDREARAAAEELERIAAGGFVLLVEETDAALRDGDPKRPGAGLTVGRPLEAYADWMRPWTLCESVPRRIEPGYARADVGTFMLFRAR